MAAGLMKSKKQHEEIVPNKLCAGCRRTCKQPEFALISSCPRYYPMGKKQKTAREWKQQELFSEIVPKRRTGRRTDDSKN